MPAVRANAKASSAAATSKAAKFSKPTGVTKVTKSRGKLCGFAGMPKKVQKRIWEFAASPGGTMKLTGNLFQSSSWHGQFFKRVSKNRIGSYVNKRVKCSTKTARANAHARNKLKEVCSLSRLVVLESWQKDIEAIPSRGTQRGGTGASAKQVTEGQAEINDLLNGLIARVLQSSDLKNVDDNGRDINRARHMAIPKTKVITSFNPFRELPHALRRRIWGFAATPNGEILLDKRFVTQSTTGQGFFKATSESWLPYLGKHAVWENSPAGRAALKATAVARTKLMRICSLSREVAIVAFRSDVQRIPELGYLNWQGNMLYDREDKKKVMALPDGLLTDMKSHDGKRGVVIQSLLSITSSGIVARSFKRFPQLPKEIQMMIWEHASMPSSPIELGYNLIRGFDFFIKPLNDQFYERLRQEILNGKFKKRFFKPTSKKHLPDQITTNTIARRKIRANALNRTKLLHLCPLSRQVMLKIWKKEVEAASPRIQRSNPGFAALANERIAEITKILDRLIMQLERGNKKGT